MKPSLKLVSYVVTVIGTLICGWLFGQAWRQVNPADPSTGGAERSGSVLTNIQAEAGGTNALTVGTPAAVGAPTEPAAEGVEPPVDAGAVDREAPVETSAITVSGRVWSRVLFWGFFGLISVAGLGSLVAYDLTQYAGNRASDTLFDHKGEGLPESIGDLVEKAHGEGEFLEAIRLLRDHLAQHPKAVDAQIRIAELYEKDMNNPLAAALEYEEVLKLPIRPDKRGWTCIHLVNLYNRMEKPDQAVAWLQRVVSECPGTPAAAKAQERLQAAGLEVPEAPEEHKTPPPDEPPSNLPPGFRPRGS